MIELEVNSNHADSMDSSIREEKEVEHLKKPK